MVVQGIMQHQVDHPLVPYTGRSSLAPSSCASELDDRVLEQGHGNLQDLLAEQLSQAEYMRQRQQLDKRAIRLLLRSQQLATFCRKSEVEALQQNFKQERAALQRDLAAVEAALSAAQLSVARWKRSVAHQAVQLHSAREDLEQSQLQVQLLRLEGEAQARRFASLMQGKAALCTELQQQLALGCQREVGLKDALLAAQTVAASEQGRVRELEGSLAEAHEAVAGAQSSAADKLAAAEQRSRSADERVHLAEQVAAAARERVSLAEQRVQQLTDAVEERRGWAADLSKGPTLHESVQERLAAAEERAAALETRLNAQIQELQEALRNAEARWAAAPASETGTADKAAQELAQLRSQVAHQKTELGRLQRQQRSAGRAQGHSEEAALRPQSQPAMDVAKPRPAPGDSSQPAEAADTATEQQQAAEARQPATDDIQVAQGTEAGARTRSRKAASGRAAEPSKPASPAVNEEIAGRRAGRERSKAQPYWMSAAGSPAALDLGASAGRPAAEPSNAACQDADKLRGRASRKRNSEQSLDRSAAQHKRGKGASQSQNAAAQEEVHVEGTIAEAAAEERVHVEGSTAPAADANPAANAGPVDASEASKGSLQAPSAKEAAATMQLRPVGVSKIDLASSFVDAVSPTGTSATCSTAQHLTQAAAAAVAGNAAATVTDAAVADQAPRMSRDPLGALNTRVLTAAGKRNVGNPSSHAKMVIQKALTARHGGTAAAAQRPKRSLLAPINMNYSSAANSHMVPASVLFGEALKPKLRK